MEIDTRIVFHQTPATGIANGMIPGMVVCDMRTMGDLLADLAGDTSIVALHHDVVMACADLDREFATFVLVAV